MELRQLTPSAIRRVYDAHMAEAFPPAERKPLRAILTLVQRGGYEGWGFYEDDALAAFAFFYRFEGCCLLDYFAVLPALRGQGVGTAFVRALAAYTAPAWLLAEAEAPDGGPEDAVRLRRIAFYLRAGFIRTQAMCRLYGVEYCVLAREMPAAMHTPELLCLLDRLYDALHTRPPGDRLLPPVQRRVHLWAAPAR